ncbi:hypothetical protein SKAU_G00005320 [Synaphobranchus kaupii]|uniref:Uncharacterized protein n=1 Tax=Synaphobranchus kaupii TaxID=118154 RepID=A0A9Q1JD01_SYNKA|nr:hypothetical protein SKAU_G00005320 [Synaphobranchus kaupii]
MSDITGGCGRSIDRRVLRGQRQPRQRKWRKTPAARQPLSATAGRDARRRRWSEARKNTRAAARSPFSANGALAPRDSPT